MIAKVSAIASLTEKIGRLEAQLRQTECELSNEKALAKKVASTIQSFQTSSIRQFVAFEVSYRLSKDHLTSSEAATERRPDWQGDCVPVIIRSEKTELVPDSASIRLTLPATECERTVVWFLKTLAKTISDVPALVSRSCNKELSFVEMKEHEDQSFKGMLLDWSA